MKKYTDWFPFNIKPKRIGIYQIRRICHQSIPIYKYWNGKFWFHASLNIEEALFNFKEGTKTNLKDAWRGLANNPEETA